MRLLKPRLLQRYAHFILPGIVGLLLLTASPCKLPGAEPGSTLEPSTVLYDIPAISASSNRLADQWLAKRSWTRLKEDDTAHRFKGAAMLVNNQIVAVLQKDSLAVDLYTRQASGVKFCARLHPISGGSDAKLKRTSLVIKENNTSSVSLEVGLRTAFGKPGAITYELNAGMPFLKTTAGGGVEKLEVQAPCRFAVMPDFFGDDMVVDAATIPVPRAELPSENFLLHLMHHGETMLMTVSEARDNDIEIKVSGNAPREIVSSKITYGKQPHIWLAVLTGQGIWHERNIAAEEAGKIIGLDWQMPFPALWRVDWSTADKLTDSWEMLLQQSDGKYVMQGWFGQDESEGQRFGKEFGPRDWNKPGRSRWNPVLGSFAFPCWIDHDRQGYLQPLKQRRYTERGPVCNFAGPALIYPLDRIKAPFSTPIECLTVVDLVRMTLGVGPCQYILDLEGQKRNSRGVATCYARDVINAIYQENRQLQNRPEIEEQLRAAVAFIRNVRERIDEYVKFGQEMTTYLQEQKRRDPSHAAFIDELLPAVKRLDQFFVDNREKIHTPEFAQQTADDFRAKLLTYTEKDAYQKCAAQMAIFTSIGGAQDSLVASCRMIVKVLRQQSGIAMTMDSSLKILASEIRRRTQTMLRNPTPYEAPRH